MVGDITATNIGHVGPSEDPPTHQHFARRDGHDRPGGGADLACIYNLKVRRGDFREACRVWEEHVPRQDLERFRL